MNEWTIETLKEYMESMLAERQRAIDAALVAQKSAIEAALAAADRAVLKAEMAAEKRFEAVNEFRSQLKDQQSGLITRTEADAEFRAIREKIDDLVNRVTKSEGKGSGLAASWSYLIAAIGVIATLVALWKR